MRVSDGDSVGKNCLDLCEQILLIPAQNAKDDDTRVNCIQFFTNALLALLEELEKQKKSSLLREIIVKLHSCGGEGYRETWKNVLVSMMKRCEALCRGSAWRSQENGRRGIHLLQLFNEIAQVRPGQASQVLDPVFEIIQVIVGGENAVVLSLTAPTNQEWSKGGNLGAKTSPIETNVLRYACRAVELVSFWE